MFIVYTILFWLANIGMTKFLWAAIDNGQIIDVLFKWQNMLGDMYASKSLGIHLLGKFLGNCSQCFYHCVTILNFMLYCVFVNKFDTWMFTGITTNIIWYIVYVSIGWWSSLTINKPE